MTAQAWILIAVIAAVLVVALVVAGFVRYRRGRVTLTSAAPDKEIADRSGGYSASGGFNFSQGGAGTGTLTPPRPEPVPVERTDDEGQPHVGDDAAIPRDSARRSITDIRLPEPEAGVTEAAAATPETAVAEPTEAEAPSPETAPAETAAQAVTPLVAEPDGAPTPTLTEVASPGAAPTAPPEAAPTIAPEAPAPAPTPAPELEEIAPTAGRLIRLRGRLARSQTAMGKSLLGLLGGGDLDEDSWEEIEDTLVMADLGTSVTGTIVERLRAELAARSVRTADEARAALRAVLVEALRPELDRSIRALPHDDHPSILLVVGVNGTGKTTTTGKLARVLVADGRRVLLGAADTFRAAAADQLQTWGERVGAETVRGREGADPASVAFDAVSAGIDNGVDVVLVDTAGRLHTKTGLMDELGKVKRVVEKKAAVDEVLLVLDATVGQNGLNQARVFAEVVDISGVVLTKLDGTAKGGIVFQVQHELGVPVKLVGLGEGADDLAPFEPGAFVDALLG
ncbi:signal recognition particle-docking protein FtsY [Nocardia sp. NEAU-G5]|uniref:Signal recognition particle receptor FtsY n=1 Tax=Nocardia albiluteola TaxID=2842303 RepID=A0ABS6B0M2_9NOCA|nr:signal recognition particle-docking protein FtsY [Nocardia albiluteola]MBU3063844.1 signal recognition particle-docking protein FtsY [Nocardia albiluteola]